MLKIYKEFKMPYEFDGNCGELTINADLEIQQAYFGSKVDEVNEYHNAELINFDIKEASFVDDTSKWERNLTKAEINEIYKDVKDYVIEHLDDFIE